MCMLKQTFSSIELSLFFRSSCFFSAIWKFYVPPTLLRTATSQPPFLVRHFIYIAEVCFCFFFSQQEVELECSDYSRRSCHVQPQSESLKLTGGLSVGDFVVAPAKNEKETLLSDSQGSMYVSTSAASQTIVWKVDFIIYFWICSLNGRWFILNKLGIYY